MKKLEKNPVPLEWGANGKEKGKLVERCSGLKSQGACFKIYGSYQVMRGDPLGDH